MIWQAIIGQECDEDSILKKGIIIFYYRIFLLNKKRSTLLFTPLFVFKHWYKSKILQFMFFNSAIRGL